MNPSNATNARRLLIAGFTAILAAGMGFAIRGAILDNWGRAWGFTNEQLGSISGAGFTGFCFGIIVGGLVADRLGYGKLVVVAFALHVLSALITFAPGDETAASAAYDLLYWGTFVFAVANGTLEAVANPLVATLYPTNRTHYLNILHASWPLGLVLGGIVGWVLDDRMELDWKLQLGIFLVPVVLYGLMFFQQHMPKSEASAKGLPLGEMLKDVGLLGASVVCVLLALFFSDALHLDRSLAWGIAGALLLTVGWLTRFALGSILLFTLFLAHALVGAVELGTDGWIQNITGNILSSEQGKILFVITSATMFLLRFCARWIEGRLKLSPIGILFVSALLACLGLNFVAGLTAFGGAMGALLVYAVGKTFFWPTMLAVTSDRFPRTGAIAISIMGGIGMMSAGLIGLPGLGYAKDRFSGEALEVNAPALVAEYRAEKPSNFLSLGEAHGLDAKKTGAIDAKLKVARENLNATADRDPAKALDALSAAERAVHDAQIAGDRRTLKTDAWIPAAMAGIFLLILLWFRSRGGYRTVRLE
ncbi:MAG: MFS transporter [Planctomycetes bacterium]|nr:MFS transporter [Planctomycetota bacterium]